jgi:hypothetical protein
MGLIVLPSGNTGASKARIGYENLLESAATVTASSEDAANPVKNAYDWLTYDFFKPAAGGTVNIDAEFASEVTADYFGFYNQNLYQLGGSIKLQYWDGAAYQDCFTAILPADNSPQMKVFASQTSTKWRIVVQCDDVFALGCVSFGAHLPLQFGMYLNWTPPVLARNTKRLTNTSDTGAILGNSVIALGVKTNLVLQYATDAWVRANWLPFVKHMEEKPFFFVPNIVEYPFEAVFCQVDGDIPVPTHTHYGRMGVTVPVEGFVE